MLAPIEGRIHDRAAWFQIEFQTTLALAMARALCTVGTVASAVGADVRDDSTPAHRVRTARVRCDAQGGDHRDCGVRYARASTIAFWLIAMVIAFDNVIRRHRIVGIVHPGSRCTPGGRTARGATSKVDVSRCRSGLPRLADANPSGQSREFVGSAAAHDLFTALGRQKVSTRSNSLAGSISFNWR